MKLNKLFTAIAILILFCSGYVVKLAPINKAEWVIGTWENKSKKGSIYETWIKVSKVEFLGKSYALKDKDTSVFENIQLLQKQNSLFYIPIVKNQNNNLPVSFSLQKISDNQFIFENLKHDFPQFISYRKITPDSLIAEIYGTINGQDRKQIYPMKRIK